MKQESEAAAATAVGQASAPVPQASSSLGMDPQQMQATLQMMRENPSTPEQMRTAFAHMSPEQLQAAVSTACLLGLVWPPRLCCIQEPRGTANESSQ